MPQGFPIRPAIGVHLVGAEGQPDGAIREGAAVNERDQFFQGKGLAAGLGRLVELSVVFIHYPVAD